MGSGKQATFFCKKGPIKFGSLQNYAKLGSNFWILRIVVSLSLLCHPSLAWGMRGTEARKGFVELLVALKSEKVIEILNRNIE